ncbi:MAG: hypothetical protein GXC76_04735 [Rhodanobacteraceae bacterium]|jgi:hypothetical protein|nr:hypothetical protein [Rhodanobacteraceae bacterium]
MTLRLAKLLLLSLFPLAGTAQTLPSLAPSVMERTPLVEQLLALGASGGQRQLAHGEPVLPIWSGENGQLLAVIALPRSWAGSPIDPVPGQGAEASVWRLAGGIDASSGGGLRWQFGNGLRADATFGQYLASTTPSCLACDMPASSRWTRSSLGGSLGLGWTSADGGLDLSYGLSWLQTQGSGPAFGNRFGGLPLAEGAVPVLTLPEASSAFALDRENGLYARGRWQFHPGATLDIGASYARGSLSALGGLGRPGPSIDLDQLSLSLGLDAGSLRGAVVGHVLSSDDPALAGKRWTTLDLGVSWRTPWSGELSVGAQNLWSAPLNSPRDAENQARTPYIQYRQDL